MCHYRSNTNIKARGVYIAGTEATCGNGPSYFVYLTSNNTNLLSYLRDGSETNIATVRMNYCVQNLNLFGNLNLSNTYSVAQSIVSSQNIADGKIVRYEAGTFIELNDGFVSGTDFVAEINPCVSIITTIAAKTDDEQTYQYEHQNYKTIEKTPSDDDWLKVYPTILSSGNSLTIEANDVIDGVELRLFDMQGKHIRSFKLYSFLKGKTALVSIDVIQGLYILKAQKGLKSFTQKIIVQ